MESVEDDLEDGEIEEEILQDSKKDDSMGEDNRVATNLIEPPTQSHHSEEYQRESKKQKIEHEQENYDQSYQKSISDSVQRRIFDSPYQSEHSNNLLSFNQWVSVPRNFSLLIPDIQNILMEKSSFINLPVSPKKIVLVLLETVSPLILRDYLEELPTLSKFSSMPLQLAHSLEKRSVETPLSQLLFQVPQKEIDIWDMSLDELFDGNELTFNAVHSFWTDKIILKANGEFFRVMTNDQGIWKLDGDLLHLEWNLRQKDVLICEDDHGRIFKSSDVIDKTYSPQMFQENQKLIRNMTLTLEKAVKSSKLLKRTTNLTTQEKPKEDKSYFTLTQEELESNGYPLELYLEQQKLNERFSKDRYRETLPLPSGVIVPEENDILALDCEMCETDLGMEVTRVTIVNRKGEEIYESLIRPQSTIINFHTEFSGISKEMLENVTTKLCEVQDELLSLIFQETILVGHSLVNDLRALRLLHLNVADTAVLYPHPRGFPFKLSLKKLAEQYLNKSIQSKSEGHDSKEDAIASLELFLLKLEKGGDFGVPNCRNDESSNTLLDSLSRSFSFYSVNPTCEKPWNLMKDLNLSMYLEEFDHLDHVIHNEKATSLEDLMKSWKNHSLKKTETELSYIQLVERCLHSTTLCVEDYNKWESLQVQYLKKLDAMMLDIYSNLPKDSLVLVIPQDDIQTLRHLKALRQQSKWQEKEDTGAFWSDNHQFAIESVLQGMTDSFVLIDYK